jgi:hypothetical protein
VQFPLASLQGQKFVKEINSCTLFLEIPIYCFLKLVFQVAALSEFLALPSDPQEGEINNFFYPCASE